MTEFAEGFGLYLPYPFSCDIEFFSDFLKGPCSAVLQAESEFENFLLYLVEGIEYLKQLFFEHGKSGGFCRSRNILIRNKISQMAVFFLSDRGFQ